MADHADHRDRIAASDLAGLAVVLAVAVALRAFAWSNTAVLFNDGPIFLALAEAIGEGRWTEVLAHPYHPLYPTLIALVAAFPVELETAAVIVSIAGGAIAVLALFWFVRDAFGRDVAWLAAWILALHPWAIDFSSDVMSEGIYVGLFLVGFALMVKVVDRPTLKNAMACGAACGLAFLARPEGAGLLIAGAALLGARAIREHALRGRAAVALMGLVIAGLIVIGPFVVAVSRVTGEFTVTQKKSIARLVADPSSEGALVANRLERERMAEVAPDLPLPELAIRADGPGAIRPERNFLGFIDATVRVNTTAMSAFRWELMLLALIGIFAGGASRNLRREQAIGLVLAFYMGLLLLLVWGAGYVSRRHALPPWLPMIGFSALGVRFLWTTTVARFAGRNVALTARLHDPRILCVALIVTLVVGWGARDIRERRVDRASVRAAAQWLAENRPDSGPVAAQKLRVAYYAGARFVPLATGHDGRLEDYLRGRGTRWVVIDRAKLADHRGLGEGIGQWLRLVHTSASQGRLVFVLSVAPKPAS